jgi:hypothetical protein
MRAHGRDDERLEPEAANRLGRGVHDPRQTGYAPAARGDGNPPTGKYSSRQMAGSDGACDMCGRIIDLGLNEPATNTSNRRQIHRCWARFHEGGLIPGRLVETCRPGTLAAVLTTNMGDTVKQPLYRLSFEAPKPLTTTRAVAWGWLLVLFWPRPKTAEQDFE